MDKGTRCHLSSTACFRVISIYVYLFFIGCAGVLVGHPFDTIKVCCRSNLVRTFCMYYLCMYVVGEGLIRP
jgi:hypothetical protein